MRGLVVLLLVFAGCAQVPHGSDAFDPVHAPTWHSGHRFSYQVEGHADWRFSLTVDGALVDEDASTNGLSVNLTEEVISTRLRASGEPVYLMLADLDGLWLRALRQSDLQPVPVEHDEDIAFGPPSPHASFRFPLRAGDTWSTVETVPAEAGEIRMHWTAAVEGEETVATPAGVLSAIRVRHTVSLDPEFERQFEQSLRDQGFEDVEATVQTHGEIVLHYAAAAATTARTTQAIGISIDVSATYDGMPVAIHTSGAIDMQADLLGTALQAKPDRSRAQVLTMMEDGPEPPEPVAPLIDIATVPPVNAAHGDPARFALATPVPDGHEVAWTVSDTSGVLAAATGDSFEHAFDRPGRFRLQADLRAQDVVASDTVAVVVGYDGPVAGTCPPVALGGVLPCDRVAFPVGDDVPRLSVTARPVGIGSPGTLVLTAPDGTTFDDPEQVSVVQPQAGRWSFHYEPLADVLPSIQYDVHALGSQPEDASPLRLDPGALAAATLLHAWPGLAADHLALHQANPL